MKIFETVKGTVNTAVDTLSSVTQTIIERNRTNAKLNRLRIVMKNESELMNRAYISLGKLYYESEKKNVKVDKADSQKLMDVIESSKARIAKARECYRKIVDSQNDVFYGVPENTDCCNENIVDITVACSNENEYESSPFENVEPSVEENTELEEATVESMPDNNASEKLINLKEELQSKKIAVERFAEPVDDEEADDEEAPDGELF